MKKKFFALLCMTFLFTGITLAQKKVYMGLKGGINYASISHVPNDPKVGLNAGIFVHIQKSKVFALRPELVYSRQGNSPIAGSKTNYDIGYIGVALANKFYPIKNVGFNFLLGPEINIFSPFDLNGEDDSTFFGDIALFAGLAYESPVGIGLEAKFKQGIFDVEGNNILWGIPINNRPNRLNQVVQFALTWQFDVSRKESEPNDDKMK